MYVQELEGDFRVVSKQKALTCRHFDTNYTTCPRSDSAGIKNLIAYTFALYNSAGFQKIDEVLLDANTICAICTDFRPLMEGNEPIMVTTQTALGCRRLVSDNKPCPNKEKEVIRRLRDLITTDTPYSQVRINTDVFEAADRICRFCDHFEPER